MDWGPTARRSGLGWVLSYLRRYLTSAPSVCRVMPIHPLGPRGIFDLGQVQVHYHGLLVTADHHAAQLLPGIGVDLLVRHERRHVNEIAGARLGHELQSVAPPHAGPPGHDVDHAFQGTVVMRAGLGTGLDYYGTGPDLLSPGRCAADRGFAIHAGRLRRVRVELALPHDPHAGLAPLGRIAGHALPPKASTDAGR